MILLHLLHFNSMPFWFSLAIRLPHPHLKSPLSQLYPLSSSPFSQITEFDILSIVSLRPPPFFNDNITELSSFKVFLQSDINSFGHLLIYGELTLADLKNIRWKFL